MTQKYWKMMFIIGLMTALSGSAVNTTMSRFQTDLEADTTVRTAAFQLEMLSPDGSEPVSLLYFESSGAGTEYPFLVRNNSEVSVICSLSCEPADYAVQFSPSDFTLGPGETRAVEAVISPTTGTPVTEQTEIVLRATQAD